MAEESDCCCRFLGRDVAAIPVLVGHKLGHSQWKGCRVVAESSSESCRGASSGFAKAVKSISHPVPATLFRDAETGDGPRGEQIVLLLAGDESGVRNKFVPDMTKRVIENRQEYASWHGYSFQFIDMSTMFFPGHAVWKKIAAIKQAFLDNPKAEWVWWLDLDAIIMTAHAPLSTHLLHPSVLDKKLLRGEPLHHNRLRNTTLLDTKVEDVDLIYAQDQNGLNAGSLFFRRSNWTDRLLDIWTTPQMMLNFSAGFREQDALAYLLNTHDEVFNHTGLVDARWFNAYKDAWRTNDLVVHFAGCYAPFACRHSWERFWALRSPVPTKFLQAVRSFW